MVSFTLLTNALLINSTGSWVGSGVSLNHLGADKSVSSCHRCPVTPLFYPKISQLWKRFGLHCTALSHQIFFRNVDWVTNQLIHIRKKVQRIVHFQVWSCDPVHIGLAVSPWSVKLFQKLTFTHKSRNYFHFVTIGKFTAVLTKANHLSLFWARLIRSIPY